jgi:hypothetical protein
MDGMGQRALVACMLALAACTGATLAAAQGPAHVAVDAFVKRVAGVEIRDLLIEQTITLYHPDGIQPASKGEQRLLIKPPGRQRLEESIEGRREVRLVVGGRTWIRRDDGKTYEAPPAPGADRNHAHLMVPLQRTAEELLSAWRALGVRADVTDTVRVGGRPVTVIGARAGDRQSPAVWLDPEFGVVRFVGRETLPKGPAVIDLAFSDHRPLAGAFRFPHRQEVFVDGRLVVLISVRTAIANADLSDALFDPEALGHER